MENFTPRLCLGGIRGSMFPGRTVPAEMGTDPSPVPRPLVKAYGAVHPLPRGEGKHQAGDARAPNELFSLSRGERRGSTRLKRTLFPFPWGEGGRGTRSGEGFLVPIPLRGQHGKAPSLPWDTCLCPHPRRGKGLGQAYELGSERAPRRVGFGGKGRHGGLRPASALCLRPKAALHRSIVNLGTLGARGLQVRST